MEYISEKYYEGKYSGEKAGSSESPTRASLKLGGQANTWVGRRLSGWGTVQRP